MVYLAASPEVSDVTGQYFYQCKPQAPTKEAQNDADAAKLWQVSEGIAGL